MHPAGRIPSYLASIVLATILASCSYGHRIAYHVFEGPLDAISISHVAPNKVLVLAGTVEEGKNVSVFYDAINSEEVMRFPVSRFATALRASSGDRFYLSIAGSATHRGTVSEWGALQEWNLRGQLLSTTVVPGRALAIARASAPVMFVLLARKNVRTAVGIRLSDGRTVARIPLPDDVDGLDQCALRGEPYLLFATGRAHRVELMSTTSRTIVETPMSAREPRCFADLARIAGIDVRPFGVDVSLLTLSARDQRSESIVAPADTVGIEPTDDGNLYLLRRFGGDSNIQFWTHDELADHG